MKRAKQVLWTAMAAPLLVGQCAFAGDRTERVTLVDGTTTLKGEISGHDSVQYAFTAAPGQQLMIRLATSNASNYINVERSGLADAICQGSLTGNTCSVRSESAADYVVDVFLMRNAARRGEKAAYTLSIEPGGASPRPSTGAGQDASAKEAAAAAVAACKSALALKSGVNAVFVLPVSHVPAAGGYEVFLSLKGASWLCTTDPRGNVNRLEQR